jgi:hypothetical protein
MGTEKETVRKMQIREIGVCMRTSYRLRRYSWTISVLAAVSFALPPHLLWSQRTSSVITGVITDSSNAVVTNAKVAVTETSTGVSTAAETNSQGRYMISNLPPGSYLLDVTATGFQNYEQAGIVLQAGQPATVDIGLSVGSASQQITVNGAPPLVNTQNATVSYAITPAFTEEIPLNGRNVLQLLSVAPDTSGHVGTNYSNEIATRPETNDAGFVTASGESRENSTTYYLDGGLNEDTYTDVANVFPNPDAVQEFTADTNVYSAKFGGRGGGIVNVVTKGGTNKPHGTAYEYLRNGAMDAANYFSTSPDSLKRNQFGFSLGGPIRKGKTFLFGAFQRTTNRYGTTSGIAFGPTAAELAGDWSAINAPLSNPLTGAAFAKNQISPSLYNPISLKVLALVPEGDPVTGQFNYLSRQLQNDNQYVVRGDQYLGGKAVISASYLWDKQDDPNLADPKNVVTGGPNQQWLSQHAALNISYTLSPNLITTVGGSFSRVLNRYTGSTLFPSLADLGANYPVWDPKGVDEVGFDIDGWFTAYWLGANNVTRTEDDITNNWTYTHGRHTLDFGGELALFQSVLYQAYVSSGYQGWWCGNSGYSPVDFMLGSNCFYEQYAPSYVAPRGKGPGLYANDTWRITPRLTANLGVRWEPWLPWPDAGVGKIGGQINMTALANNVHSTRYPNLPAGFLVRGDQGVPAGLVSSAWHLFSPRIGLAWDVDGDGKTSVRAGFGIYHDQPFGRMYNQMMSTLPFTEGAVITQSNISAYDPYSAPPYNGKIPQLESPPPSDSVFPLPLTNAVGFSPNFKPPTILQWNFTLEHQVGAGILLHMGYEASESYHMFDSRDVNAATANVRPFTAQGYGGTVILNESTVTSSYNAMVLSAEKRMTGGLSFLGGFRWAKCLDLAGSTASFSINEFTDAKNPSVDRGICNSDVATQFKMAAVWDIPTVGSLGFVGRHILNGWTTSGILSQHAGYPFSVNANGDRNEDGTVNDRADLVAVNPYLPGNRDHAAKLQEWFNTSAFANPALGSDGNTSRNFLRGPRFVNFDFALVRSFSMPFGPFKEGQKLNFRAEAFNLLNHPNFDNPDAAIGDGPQFGRILSAESPRIMQVALKYSF